MRNWFLPRRSVTCGPSSYEIIWHWELVFFPSFFTSIFFLKLQCITLQNNFFLRARPGFCIHWYGSRGDLIIQLTILFFSHSVENNNFSSTQKLKIPKFSSLWHGEIVHVQGGSVDTLSLIASVTTSFYLKILGFSFQLV